MTRGAAGIFSRFHRMLAAARVAWRDESAGVDLKMLDILMDAGALLDMSGKFLRANAAFAAMVGYGEKELREMTFRDLTPQKWREAEEELIRSQVLVRGYSDIYRKEYRRRDGVLIPVELRTVLMRDSGRDPCGMWAIVRDISERVAAEEKLRTSENFLMSIIDQSPTPTWISDREGTLIKINRACLDLLHLSQEEVLGVYNVFRDDLVEQQGLAPLIRRVYDARVPVRFKIMWDAAKLRSLSVKDHTAVVLHTSVFPIVDAAGTLTNAVFQHLDVTGLTQAEEEKARLEEQLLQAQKMESIGRLAGGVAHDFNNMLGVILGYADLIKKRLPSWDPSRADVEEIEHAASRSAEITRQLLAFSRKQMIEPHVMDLNDAIDRIRSTLARVIGEDIILRFDPGLDLRRICIDPTQLNQILMNLAANARDAMPNGGLLRIATTNTTLGERYRREHLGCTPGPHVAITVEDNGIGMDGETLAHLFEPFFTTKEPGKGTGLGLATVYGIVQQNSGLIEVTSSKGGGTCFHIFLPAAQEEAGISKKPHVDVEGEELLAVRALLVEDDVMVRRMVSSLLRAIGCEVHVAENPLQAIEMFRRGPSNVDIVVSDVIMPGMTGAELCNAIRRVKPEVPVLFMSGYAKEVIAHHGVLEHGVHFIQKPFGKNLLAEKFREALHREGGSNSGGPRPSG